MISLEAAAETGADYFAGAGIACAFLKGYLAVKGKEKKGDLKLYLTDGDVLRLSVRVVAYFQIGVLLALFIRFLIKVTIRRMRGLWKREKLTA